MRTLKAIAKGTGIALAVLVGLLLIVLVVMPPLTRSLTDRLGASDAEVSAELPGDDLVADPQQSSTRAVTVEAPPELVFALVKQMGYGRGGWYAWDWFYQSTGSADFVDGHHSMRIDPALQRFGRGDSIEIFPGGALDAVIFDAPRTLVLYKMTDADNKLVPVGSSRPEVYSDLAWAWIVQPAENGTTRLILRTRASSKGLGGFADWINDGPLEMGSAVFGYKTLRGLARTAEQLHAAGVSVDENGVQTAGPTGDLGKGEAR